jgi:hypothetical protein
MTNDNEIKEDLKFILLILGIFLLQFTTLYITFNGNTYVIGLTQLQTLIIAIGVTFLHYIKKLSKEEDTDEP